MVLRKLCGGGRLLRNLWARMYTTAKMTYPVRPGEGLLNGRLIDDEHWQKVSAIFPNERWDAECSKLLEDRYEEREISIENGRLKVPSLDKEGFAMITSPTATDTTEDYLKEVESTLQSTFKTKAVVPFHWLVRDSRRDNLDSSKGPASQAHAPVSRVHGDYTIKNAPLRFEELQAHGKLPKELSHETQHWAIINVWRSLSNEPIHTKPLALLDASSIQFDHLFEYNLVSRNNVGRNYSIAFSKNHRWLFFPEMQGDEALLFFTFEHLPNHAKAGRYVFHSACDPSSSRDVHPPEAQPPRISIEVRSLVIFDD